MLYSISVTLSWNYETFQITQVLSCDSVLSGAFSSVLASTFIAINSVPPNKSIYLSICGQDTHSQCPWNWNLVTYIFFQSLFVPSTLQNACRRNGCSCYYANPYSNFLSRHICSTCNFVYWLRSFTAYLLFKSPFREQHHDDSTPLWGIRSLSIWSYDPFNESKKPFKVLILMKTFSISSECLFHLIRTDESKCSQSFDPELECKVLVNLLFRSQVNVA